MYNTFIHEQRMARFKELQQSRAKQAKWHKRYQTQIQPYLLEHYEKRINSFIHIVGEKPIVINPQRQLPKEDKRKSLVFKNVEDWRSFYNIREREEIKHHQKFISLKNMRETRKIIPAKYSIPFREYRSRSKQLEIHPPMRYSSTKRHQDNELADQNRRKPSKKQLLKAHKAKQRQRSKFELQPIKQNHSNHSNFLTTHQSSLNSKHHDEDEGDFLKHERTQNIQIQARIYEKQRQVVEKKLHFKKLLDLSVKNPNESNRRQFKTILQRCGLMRGKRGSLRSETTQMDKFTSLVQTADKQRQKQST